MSESVMSKAERAARQIIRKFLFCHRECQFVLEPAQGGEGFHAGIMLDSGVFIFGAVERTKAEAVIVLSGEIVRGGE